MKAAGKTKLHKNCFKCPPKFLRVTKTMGVYIGHPMCETTRKPKVLANTRDKEVINQNDVGWN